MAGAWAAAAGGFGWATVEFALVIRRHLAARRLIARGLAAWADFSDIAKPRGDR